MFVVKKSFLVYRPLLFNAILCSYVTIFNGNVMEITVFKPDHNSYKHGRVQVNTELFTVKRSAEEKNGITFQHYDKGPFSVKDCPGSSATTFDKIMVIIFENHFCSLGKPIIYNFTSKTFNIIPDAFLKLQRKVKDETSQHE